MARKSTGNKYDTLKIPVELTEKIDIIKNDSDYTSRTDVVKDCVRIMWRNRYGYKSPAEVKNAKKKAEEETN